MSAHADLLAAYLATLDDGALAALTDKARAVELLDNYARRYSPPEEVAP